MRKYASRTTKITKDMITDAKELIEILGFPILDAKSEAEAQASYLVKNGDAFGVASQDVDSLMFGAERLIRNLSVFGKRKKPNKFAFERINPECITLIETLETLSINHDQFIVLCMLVGTDYNTNGIKGIGPKNALKLVKKHNTNFDALFDEVKWAESFDINWQEIFELIKNMPVTEKYKLTWNTIDDEKLIKFLVDKHDFSEERIKSALEKIEEEKKNKVQKGLGEFFD